LNETYGAKSYQVIKALGFEPEKLNREELGSRFPQFAADEGYLDVKGGYFNLPEITNYLTDQLKRRGVKIVENAEVSVITSNNVSVSIETSRGIFKATKLIITVGGWANDVLKLIRGNQLSLPLSFDKPKECKYYYPEADQFGQFLPDQFPVFAYLDIGIYGHPIFDRKKGAVKISYYNPPDLKKTTGSKISSVKDFITECLPSLADVPSEDVKDADQCTYDLVDDDNFILGEVPGYENMFIGAGWRGTGYKFSPLIGRTLSELAIESKTSLDISTFTPGRFVK
jgi:glycine/D-amino acid oxidase-like deaminating enzyme